MSPSQGVTALGDQVYNLHTLMFVVSLMIGVGVGLAMLYSIVRHRRSRGATATPFHESAWVEIAWTVIPFVVLAAVAIPAARTLGLMAHNGSPDVVIDVTAHQSRWEYSYPGAGVHVYSRRHAASNAARQDFSGSDPSKVLHDRRDVDHAMVVPVHATVLLRITSADAVHGWWVPALGDRTEAIPGKINKKSFRTDKIGLFRGQCSVLCGRGQGFISIVVDVVSRQDYLAWLKSHGGHLPDERDL